MPRERSHWAGWLEEDSLTTDFLTDLISVFVKEPGSLFKADANNGDKTLNVTEDDYLFCANDPGTNSCIYAQTAC